MSSLVGSLRAPQCMSCMRRVTTSVGDAWLASTKQQVRGKKRLAKVSTVNVRLLKDVTRYGKEGESRSNSAAMDGNYSTSANELVHRIRDSSTPGTYAEPVLPEEDGRVYDTSSD